MMYADTDQRLFTPRREESRDGNGNVTPKTYGEIWTEYQAKFRNQGLSENELYRIHAKWRKLGKTYK